MKIYFQTLINDQTSECLPLKACVPQGLILGSLYIITLLGDIESTVKLFPRDIS